MEDTEMDIILSAVDNASDTFESVQSAAEGMGDDVAGGDGLGLFKTGSQKDIYQLHGYIIEKETLKYHL